jgi:phosphoribosylformylglycinamidine synthase
MGAKISLRRDTPCRLDAVLFGEAQSRIVVCTNEQGLDKLQEIAKEAGIRATPIGLVGGDTLSILVDDSPVIDTSIRDLATPYTDTIPSLMGR